jgi:ubiquinone/menaquinone biosynthesis C-methylase UbiE
MRPTEHARRPTDDSRSPAYWSAAAATYDRAADHGLTDADVREAWRRQLVAWLPEPPASMASLGCGTGSLALLAAEAGHHVTGVDFAAAMIERARAKADDAGVPVRYLVGDAARPPILAGTVDVILLRHVLWVLPDPADAIAHWVTLLRPDGRFVFVEGEWSTGAGLTLDRVAELLEQHCARIEVEPLPDPMLWGGPIHDERYVVRGWLA